MNILLAEDDPKIAQAVKEGLEEAGMEVMVAFDGQIAEKAFDRYSFDLILLDVNLPYKNGFELCRSFRQRNTKIPILMLTALGELDDKMDAFNAGADDYLVKPFHLKELIARINVFAKRATQTDMPQQLITVDDLVIDTEAKSVSRAGQSIKLTAKEYQLLEALARSRGRVLSKADLAEKVWDMQFDSGTNSIEVYISFLRNKIDKPFETKLIHTKTGFGYYLKERP